jgi:L-lactate dehydrogenase (cytochrome)|tara:strand:- start:657 stop:1856 length:1200 start_codon:yes stop_codon:yes gene_type:complete
MEKTLILTDLSKCHDIGDLRKAAKRRLPKTIFDFLDGGADDEVSMRQNRHSFDQYTLVPDALTDVSNIDMSTNVMGQEISFPFILSPTGMSRIFHHDGEKAVAQAAAKAGLIYSLSSNSSVSIEEIGNLTTGPKWFQIYVWKDRSLVKNFISRAREANFQALCLTVDVQVYGNRQRDLYNGMAIPIQLTPKLVLDLARHPNWLFHMISKGQPNLANLPSELVSVRKRVGSGAKYINSQFDRSVTWKDAEWMIKEWGGPLAIKGILNAQDAVQAVKIGATGIIVSNHGGRQLDHATSPMSVLPEIVDAVAGRADVIVDGGIRRGTDIVKALALGAKSCMGGRPYLYGLSAGGLTGVTHAMNIVSDELNRDMSLLGVDKIDKINAKHIRHHYNQHPYPQNF